MTKGKMLQNAVMLSLLCSCVQWGEMGFATAAAEETMKHELSPVIVEAEAEALPGGMVASKDRVGILGNVDAIDVPFTQTKYTEKTISMFEDPNQPLNGVLANNPSIRVGSPSPMYTDFNMRGVNMNAAHYYINGIPNMFNQTRSIPAYVLENVEIVSGPNTVLNGATFSNNGTNGTDAPAGLLNGVTKKAKDEPITSYTQEFSGRSTWTENLDIGRRFGENDEWGVRVNTRYSKGGLSIHGAEIDDKTIYLNIDHRSEKSTTNIFGGYFDWEVEGGQRWLKANGVEPGKFADAPDGKTDLSFDGQFKKNHGYLMTLNHTQKFSDKWSAFANMGYNYYTEHKNDPNGGSLTLGNNGLLSAKFRDYLSESRGIYTQLGVANEAKIGAIKNNLSFAVDYFNYKSRSVNSGSADGQADLVGDLWSGVHVNGTPVLAASLDSAAYSKETAMAATLADRLEFGKASLYAAVQYRDTETTSSKGKKVDKDSLNPTFAFAYKPVENLSLYASHSQSYTKPVEVAKDYVNYGEIFDPIKNKQTEVGVKYSNAGALHSLAVFQLDQASYMVEGDTSDPKNAYYTQNGKNEFKGVEYSLSGKIAPKWNLMGGVMYLHGERTSTPSVSWDSTNKILKPTASKDGWYVTGVPKWNGVLAAEYEADEDTSLIGRVNYSGKSHVNDKGVTAPSYVTFDLGIKHKTHINTLPVTLNAMCYNVLGRDYWISRVNNGVALGAPRTFMLSAQFDI